MSAIELDPVKAQVTAHWERRAAHFDEDFGHSIATPDERAAWDRILDLLVPPGSVLDALDVGCGTGFLSLELAARGHRVTGVDLAPAMLALARQKAAARGLSVRFEAADAENLPCSPGSFGLVISRHVLWTLPHPEAAIDGWIGVLRPGGRLAIIDGAQCDSDAARTPQRENARTSAEYAAIGDKLPFYGGRPRDRIEAMLRARGLAGVGSDALDDLVEAQARRLVADGQEPRRRQRYAAWGDVPG
ncbi:MAG TPA: methyltransferase domain-containing protein [Stellaceae bacterium]|nr:methyltransferase domain-containing protein [Stellaceae bacterium]